MVDIKLSEAFADLLAQQGVRHVFGIIGSANAHLFDAIYYQAEFPLIWLRNQQTYSMDLTHYETVLTSFNQFNQIPPLGPISLSFL
jgi:hypothetical protein